MEKRYRSIEEIRERYEREIPVLGQTYHIKVKDPERDPRLGKDHDGYCDWTTKEIAMSDMAQDAKHPDAVGDFDQYREKVLRHEIIHAFIEESGNTDADWNNENMVNWLACMWPHLHAAMTAAYCAGGYSARESVLKKLRGACCSPYNV